MTTKCHAGFPPFPLSSFDRQSFKRVKKQGKRYIGNEEMDKIFGLEVFPELPARLHKVFKLGSSPVHSRVSSR